jgi:hypothetical protein
MCTHELGFLPDSVSCTAHAMLQGWSSEACALESLRPVKLVQCEEADDEGRVCENSVSASKIFWCHRWRGQRFGGQVMVESSG